MATRASSIKIRSQCSLVCSMWIEMELSDLKSTFWVPCGTGSAKRIQVAARARYLDSSGCVACEVENSRERKKLTVLIHQLLHSLSRQIWIDIQIRRIMAKRLQEIRCRPFGLVEVFAFAKMGMFLLDQRADSPNAILYTGTIEPHELERALSDFRTLFGPVVVSMPFHAD